MNTTEIAWQKFRGGLTDIPVVDNDAGSAAVAGTTVAIFDVSGVTGLTNFVGSAIGNVNINLADTTNAAITNSSGSVTVTGGNAITTSGATGAVSITGAAGITSATVVGGTTVGVSDAGTEADTLTSVSVSGNSGAVTIGSDALTTLSVANSNQSVTVTAAAATRALALTVNKLTGGTIADAQATTLNITSTGTASTGVTLSAGKATSVTIAGDKALTSVAETFTVVTSITSTNTAGVTLATAIRTASSFTGGAGNDVIEIGATTKSVSMGAGVNTVKITSGVTTIGTGGTVDGGSGATDVLSMVTANAITATASTTAKAAFGAHITGFERLTLGATTADGEVKLNNLGDINYVTAADVATGKTLTLSGVTTGFTLNANAGTTGTGAVAVALATDGLTDVLNVGISNTTAKDLQALTADEFETINFVSDDTATAPAGGFLHVAALTAAAVETISVTGDAGFNLGYLGTTATLVDASGITKGDFTWTADALAESSVVKGSATGTNTLNFDNATTVATFVTYTGGTGDDVIVSTNDLDNVYILGAGDNTINSGAADGDGNNTVTAGAGDDTVQFTIGNNIVDLGNGNNVFEATSGDNTYTGGTGTDDVVVTTGSNIINVGGGTTANSVTVGAAAGLNVITTTSTGVDTIILAGIQAAAGFYTSVSGLTDGDVIDFNAVIGGTGNNSVDGALGAKITLGGASSFANYLDAAAASATGDATAAVFKWFQFAGDTYVVMDASDTTTFADGVDSVIQLVGLYDLALSETVTDVLTIA
jgi:S-layer protein